MGTSAASLGQLAVLEEVIPLEQCGRLRAVIRSRAAAGLPTSMGRLLLKGGLSGAQLRALLRKGVDLDAVSCDGCGALIPQGRLPERKEFPCGSCGALLLGFAPFRRRGREAAAPGSAATGRFPEVLPLPSSLNVATPVPAAGAPEDSETVPFDNPEGQTVHYDGVLTLPPGADEQGVDPGRQDYLFVLPDSVGQRSEEETLMIMGDLARESDEHAPLGVSNRLLEGTGDREEGSMLEQLMRREVGGFTLIRSLGKGAVGRVFLAREKSSGRRVALKVLRSEAATDLEVVQRFAREAKVVAMVQHPNIVDVVASGHDREQDMRYLALEYLEGGSLLDRLREFNQLDPSEAFKIVRGVCLALQAASSQGVIHRDIKPENILFTAEGVPKLADLGLAKVMEARSQITETGFVVGTPCYIAPEQATGEEDLDVRVDIFALGFCLWQMLTGVVPFSDVEGEAALDMLVRHIEEDLPDPRIYAHTVSDGAAQIVRGMTARDRARRYASPLHVVRDIDLLLGGAHPLSASDSVTPPYLAELRDSMRGDDQESPSDPGEHSPLAATAVAHPPKGAKTPGAGCLALALVVLVGFVALAVWAGVWLHTWYTTGQLGGG